MLRQGIRETSLLQKYPIGYRFAERGGIGDRVFRYCKADIALPLPPPLCQLGGAANGDTLHFMNTAVVAYAGDQDLTVVIGGPAAGVFDAGYVKDQFKDGYITIHTAPIQVCLKIKGNDADDGTNVVLHLEEPLLLDTPLPTFVEIHENKYHSIVPMNAAGYQSVVVVPLVPVPINHHFWGQTWGECLCTAALGGGIGGVINQRSVYFQDDGSIGDFSGLAGDFQYAGFLLPTTRAAAPNIHFMLQLAP